MLDTELLGSKALPTDQAAEIILKTPNIGSGLAKPKCRFNNCHNPSFTHRLIIVRGTGSNMNMWINKHHRSEEHTSELQSRENLVCRLLLEKKNHKRLALCLG